MFDAQINLQSFIDNRIGKFIDFEVLNNSTGQKFFDSLMPVEKKVVEVCLRNGGYIAGGCPRYVSETINHTGTYDDVDADAYRHFGDVDIFFPTEEAFKKSIQELTSSVSRVQLSLKRGQSIVSDDSKAYFAQNVSVFEENGSKKTIPFQLISCQFGSPKIILSKFDFLNSMIAFVLIEGSIRTMQPKEWLANEISNTLNVFVWDSPLSFYRIQKYTKKYGYQKLINGAGTNDQFMKDVSKTMEMLPTGVISDDDVFNPPKNPPKNLPKIDKKFTKQSYATQILSAIHCAGHIFSEETVIFLCSLCGANGAIDNQRTIAIIKYTNYLRRQSNQLQTKSRIDSWKETQREQLAKRYSTGRQDEYCIEY